MLISDWSSDVCSSDLIYGFRDADPELTSAAAAAITTATGGATGYLRHSYRTRTQLGDLFNGAFAPNLLRTGMSIEEITFDGYERQEDPELPTAVSVWEVSGKNKGVRTELLARRVAGLLADPPAWPVAHRDGTPPPATGGGE